MKDGESEKQRFVIVGPGMHESDKKKEILLFLVDFQNQFPVK